MEVISHGNDDSIGNWGKEYLHFMLARNLAEFCPYPRVLGRAEF